MSRRLPTALLLAFGAAGLLAPPAHAVPRILIAFGDSITEGYGDTSSMGGGYTRRLEHWIDQEGYDSVVENHGVGGETTHQGLSRIDSVLAGGGDFLLLMEGTNDISHHIGVESIRFNLNEMAARAEALGMIAVHATVIPRIPTALVDASNDATSALAEAIRSLGAESQRTVVDNFAVFEGLPDLFENYYYYVDGISDPVGHPNTDGYMQIAGTFLEAVLPLLLAPNIVILPPAGPVQAGALTAFGFGGDDNFVRVEWEFGDGGYAVTIPPGDLLAPYIFLHPGTYHLRIRGLKANGDVAEDTLAVTVTGPDPDWETRTTLLPLLIQSNDGQTVSDLRLANFAAFYGIAEVTFLPEVSYDGALPVRRFLVAAQGTTTLSEVLAEGFGVESGRGAAKITFYVTAAGSPGSFSASARVRAASDADGSDGATVGEIASTAWSASAKHILGIPNSFAAPATLDAANLDGVAGSVRLDLFDADDGYIGSGLLDLAAGAARLRSLADLFRGLGDRHAPFRAELGASAVRYSVAAVTANPNTDDVNVLVGAP